MTITSEIQKLEPGALVELFELDATGIGGDHNYFHSHTQYQTIWWQGNEYYPWPVQTSGFSRTSDKPPTPTVTVGNVDGSISALCIYFDDLVGAKIVRRRTLGRFLDSNNFPPITATDQQFGLSDGTKTVFALTGGPSGPSMNFAVTGIHLTDANGVTTDLTNYTQGDAGKITFAAPPPAGTLTWDGTYQNNPTADPEEEMPPEIWFIERKTAESIEAVQFELSSAMDFNGVMLPRRQIIANMCPLKYRSPECSYMGGPVADITDAPTSDPAKDRCGKRLASCRLRFGANNPLPFGGFPAAGLMRS